MENVMWDRHVRNQNIDEVEMVGTIILKNIFIEVF